MQKRLAPSRPETDRGRHLNVAFCPSIDSETVAELLLHTDHHLIIQHFVSAYELLIFR